MPATFRSVSTVVVTDLSEVPRPPSVQPGDVLYAVETFRSVDSTTSINGFSYVTEVGTGDRFVTRVWRRFVVAGEPDSYLCSQPPGAEGGTVIIIAVSGAHRSLPLVYAVTDSGTEGATPPVAPASASHLEIRIASADISGPTTWTAPPGYTMRAQASSGVIVSTGVATRQLNSSASSGAQTFGFSRLLLAWHGITLSVPSAETVPDVPPPPPFVPGRGSALYRYVFRRLLDRSYLGDLDLTGVTFDKRIGQPGQLAATIPIPSRKVANQVAEIIPRDETALDRGPGVITCEIYRAGVAWGEYWITGATISRSRRGTPAISLRGSTVDSYLTQVEVQEDLPEFIGEDQIEIARQLINHMQSQAGADIGLVLQSGVSEVPRDRTYLADSGTYGQHLQELAALDGGFEWMVNLVAGPAGLQRQWVWGYPALGEVEPQHVFVDAPHGGDILEWNEEVDALRSGTRIRVSGSSIGSDASTGSSTLYSSVHAATAHLAAGWPRIDRTIQYSDEDDVGTLDDFAAYWVAKAPGAVRVDQYTVALGAQPSLTPNNLGDKARLYIENEWHLRHSRVRRIIGLGITPVSRETGREEAQLVLEGREDA